MKPMNPMSRFIAPLLTTILIAGVGFAIYQSVMGRFAVTVLRGVVGSEKEDFFKDPALVAYLKTKGLAVEVTTAGSRQIANGFDLQGLDFAFPAGTPAADQLRKSKQVSTVYPVFFTPMVIASWDIISKILADNGVLQRQKAYDILNMDTFLPLMLKKTRWNALKNSQGYSVNKPILIYSTDVRKSNSAAMYLALVSYIANQHTVVQDNASVQRLMPQLRGLFTEQGYQESSSQGPFDDYFLIGMGKDPMVMIYESQYLEKAQKNLLRPGMRLMYPQPGIFTKHILVPFSAKGDRLGQLLSNDPKIQAIAAQYGFRSQNTQAFQAIAQKTNLAQDSALVNMADPPTYPMLEAMIQTIDIP